MLEPIIYLESSLKRPRVAYFSILEAYLDFSPRATLESAKK